MAAAAASAWVNLGYVGQALDGESVLDIRQSRLGGQPVWSVDPFADVASVSPGGQAVGANILRCGLCSGPSALVAQISAGYGSVPRRLLHIFACASGCGGCVDPRAWRVVRTVGRRDEEQHAEAEIEGAAGGGGAGDDGNTAAVGAGNDWGAGAGSNDDWNVPACGENDDWAMTAANDSATGSDINTELAVLLEARDEAASAAQRSTIATKPVAARPKNATATTFAKELGAVANMSGAVIDLWPCRALEVCYEPGPAARNDEHERELLERYLQSEMATDDVIGDGEVGGLPLPLEVAADAQLDEARLRSDEEGEARGIGNAPMDDGEGDDDDREEGNAVTYLARFQRRLERSPSQVVRYSWGGQPLWMAPPPPELGGGAWPPKCARCGAERIFEIELLPTLLSQVAAAGHAEWGVVVVYTCSKDCIGGKDGAELCEEFVVVQPAL
eukprot:TRINITY_DN74465_c0_g1_i1.p1 TRINITY_DN74465_c0_g1~~TRINITY_DN74465_c0_g1_i1.p1  ORF type:complete len:445 (+),score=97.58 TRINITY_DN74465_c0_g1_i1:214-1548(+)